MASLSALAVLGCDYVHCEPQAQQAYEFDGQIAIGGTGAPGAHTGLPVGVVLTRSNTGIYQLTFPACKRFGLSFLAVQGPTNSAANARGVRLVGSSGTGGTFDFMTVAADGSGTGTDPATGSVIYVAGKLVR